MSLILEALRKSEAERQAAQLPGLIAPARPGRAHGARRGRWLLLPLVLLLGLAIGILAPRWWSAQVTPAPDPSQMTAIGESTPAGTDNGRAAEPAPPTAQSPASPASAPVTESQVRAEAPASAAQAVRPEDPPSQGASPSLPTLPSVPSVSPGAPSAAPQAADEASRIPDAAPLSNMPPGQRQQLPELRLTVHVFNEDPARRFALVDGRRVEQGASLGNGVVLREIRREGLLLDIDGQPWLLERPR